jgi:hypothetical protein
MKTSAFILVASLIGTQAAPLSYGIPYVEGLHLQELERVYVLIGKS